MNPRRRLMLKSRRHREAEQAVETPTLSLTPPPVEVAPEENTTSTPTVEKKEEQGPRVVATKTKPTKKKTSTHKTAPKQMKKED